MDYQYDLDENKLSIKFSEIISSSMDNLQNKAFSEDLPDIQLTFSEDGKISGLEISAATRYFNLEKLEKYALNTSHSTDNAAADYQPLTKTEFSQLDCPVLFQDAADDQYFGRIQKGNYPFKFGWIRETASPSLTWLDNHTCALGIDKNFTIIQFESGTILANMALDSYFVGTYPTSEALLIATQLEILKLDLSTYTVIESVELPDFFVSMDTHSLPNTVECFDGSIITIP